MKFSRGFELQMGSVVKRGSSTGANFAPPEKPTKKGFSRFEKAAIRVQNVMLAMTLQTLLLIATENVHNYRRRDPRHPTRPEMQDLK